MYKNMISCSEECDEYSICVNKKQKRTRKKKTTEQFISEAKLIHCNVFDYSRVNYIDSKTKVIINCGIHGEFQQTPSNHLSKFGCPKCGGCNKKTTKEFIRDAKLIHNNIFDYSKVNYIDSRTKVIIICGLHGEFYQTPTNHLHKQGCPKCCGKYKTTEEFIAEATLIHDNLYNYSKVNYIDSKTKVIIICSLHGEFHQTPSNHLSKYGCPKCCGKYKTTEEFIANATLIHSNSFDYSKVHYMNARTKVNIICSKHGEFQQKPTDHLRKQGCPKCAGYNKTTEEFIAEAKLIHSSLYDYSSVSYINSLTKVNIICSIHGEFQQKPSDHLQKQGCPKCRGWYRTTEEFIVKANLIHNNLFDYSSVNYINATTIIIIICKKHGEFQQTPHMHLSNKQGCPKCWCGGFSKQQIDWLNFISIYYGITIQHALNGNEFKIPNTKLKADGYCFETNTIYEFHGDYWHGNAEIFESHEINKSSKRTFGELYDATLTREEQIRELGYNLVTMWENDWKKLNDRIKIIQKRFRCRKLTHIKK